jgi:transcriptional regulator with XRE-family HTH domain
MWESASMPNDSQTTETNFSRYLQREWMWKQEPPITTPAQLARALGIPKQTAWNWLNGGYIPEAGSLIGVASKTGIPFTTLLRLCGYPVPSNLSDSQRLADLLIDQIQQDSHPTYTREEIIQLIKGLQGQFEEQEHAS